MDIELIQKLNPKEESEFVSWEPKQKYLRIGFGKLGNLYFKVIPVTKEEFEGAKRLPLLLTHDPKKHLPSPTDGKGD